MSEEKAPYETITEDAEQDPLIELVKMLETLGKVTVINAADPVTERKEWKAPTPELLELMKKHTHAGAEKLKADPEINEIFDSKAIRLTVHKQPAALIFIDMTLHDPDATICDLKTAKAAGKIINTVLSSRIDALNERIELLKKEQEAGKEQAKA